MPDWLKLMWESLPPLLYAGLVFTVPLTLLSFAFGLTLGFVTALARLYGPRALADGFRFYVWLIRGTPLLVQLFLIFFICLIGFIKASDPPYLTYVRLRDLELLRPFLSTLTELH